MAGHGVVGRHSGFSGGFIDDAVRRAPKRLLPLAVTVALLAALLTALPARAALVDGPTIDDASYDEATDAVTVSWAGATSDDPEATVTHTVEVAGPVTGSSTTNPAVFVALAPGTYTISVVATETIGGVVTETATDSTTVEVPDPPPPVEPPSAPGGVSAVATGSSVEVTWNPAQENGTPVTGYEVTLDGATDEVGPAATTTTFTGVAVGTYTVSVVATSAEGDSPAGTSQVTVEAAVTPPGAPTGAGADVSGTSVTLSWNPPAVTGNNAATYYRVRLGNGDEQQVSGTSATFTGLIPGPFEYTVVAGNGAGDGGSAGGTFDIVTAPGAPRNPSSSVDDATVTIRWSASAANGSAISGYRISLSPARGNQARTVGADARSVQFTDVADGSYTATIVAQSDNGTSPGATTTFTVDAVGVPSAPTTVSATASGDAITVTWGASGANGSAITGYQVSLSGPGGPFNRTLGPSARSTQFGGLADGTYTASVRAVNGEGAGPTATDQATVDNVRPPDAPGGVSASADGQTVTVTWNGAQTNNSPVTGYRVTVAGISRTVGPGARRVTISDVPAGSHTVRVVATSAVGDSPAGTASVTSVVPLTAPSGPPTDVVANPDGTSVAVSWTPPAVTANNAASAFAVTLVGPGGASDTSTVGGTAVTFDQLPAGDYSVAVEARNGAGSGGSATTTFSIRTAPSAPADLVVDPDGREVTVTWSPPVSDGNSDLVDYTVNLIDVAAEASVAVVIVPAGDPLVAEFSGLELAEYSATVTARNGIGSGQPAASAVITTVRPFEPFETEEAFIAQQYRDFLGREPDAAGMTFWARATADDRSNVEEIIEAFMKSEEFAPRRSIARLYLAFFDRAPDQGGFDFWAREITSARATLDTVSQSFVGSTEFQDTYGSLSDAEFIALVYNNVLLRQPDSGGYEYWLAQMAAGLTRGELMTEFSESPEFVTATKPAVDVIVTYRGMLNREPDTAGFRFWVVQIADDPDSLQALVKGFFYTPEYAGRVVPE